MSASCEDSNYWETQWYLVAQLGGKWSLFNVEYFYNLFIEEIRLRILSDNSRMALQSINSIES